MSTPEDGGELGALRARPFARVFWVSCCGFARLARTVGPHPSFWVQYRFETR